MKEKIDSLIEYVKIRDTLDKESKIVNVVETIDKNTWNILYYLYVDDKVIYIGQSQDVNEHTELNRIIEHSRTKKFNRYKITRIPKDLDIKICETYEILKHNPTENKILSCNYTTTLSALTFVGEGRLIVEAYNNKQYNMGGDTR